MTKLMSIKRKNKNLWNTFTISIIDEIIIHSQIVYGLQFHSLILSLSKWLPRKRCVLISHYIFACNIQITY